MVDVDDVYALHAAKSLVAVGWVHTLPAAGTAADALGGVPPPVVLSGEQAHTQAAFQVALPEAVAVLVSPGRPAAAGGAGAPPGGGVTPAGLPHVPLPCGWGGRRPSRRYERVRSGTSSGRRERAAAAFLFFCCGGLFLPAGCRPVLAGGLEGASRPQLPALCSV